MYDTKHRWATCYRKVSMAVHCHVNSNSQVRVMQGHKLLFMDADSSIESLNALVKKACNVTNTLDQLYHRLHHIIQTEHAQQSPLRSPGGAAAAHSE